MLRSAGPEMSFSKPMLSWQSTNYQCLNDATCGPCGPCGPHHFGRCDTWNLEPVTLPVGHRVMRRLVSPASKTSLMAWKVERLAPKILELQDATAICKLKIPLGSNTCILTISNMQTQTTVYKSTIQFFTLC